MTEEKQRIAVFDYDGTLLKCNSLIEFIRFSKGGWKLLCGLLLFAPLIILMKLGLVESGKTKQKLFSFFFKGDAFSDFNNLCQQFKEKVSKYENEEMTDRLRCHQQQGDKVYIVSASIEQWIKSWGAEVIGTKIEVDNDGKITGRFLSPNCKGKEKVNRLLAKEPNRNDYELYAYGDSKGDDELLRFADHAVKISSTRWATATGAVLIVAAMTILLARVPFGLSYLDVGMYLAGYQHFNDEPITNYYLSQWILTYNVTGAICSWINSYNVVTLRLIHVGLTAIMVAIIALSLHRRIPVRYVFAGLALAVIGMTEGYMEVNYNDYSVALLVGAVIMIDKGREKRIYYAVSGLLIGMAFFFRIVNIAFVLLPIYAIVISKLSRTDSPSIKDWIAWVGGLAAGIGLIEVGLIATGYFDSFRLALADLTKIGSDCDDPHSIKAVLIALYSYYKSVAASSCLFICIAGLFVWAHNRWQAKQRMTAFAILSAVMIVDIYFWEPAASILIAISVAAVVTATDRKSDIYRLLLLALFVPIVYPIGSNGGITFFGQYLCLLPVPIAVSMLIERFKRQKSALIVAYIAISIAFMTIIVKREMMEEGSIADCQTAVDSNMAKGIYSSSNLANDYNMLLRELPQFVPVGSYMITNYPLPIISLTGCKPYGVYSDVFTSHEMNKRYIDVAFGQTHTLPYILINTNEERETFTRTCDYLYSKGKYENVWERDNYKLMKPCQ